MVQGMYDSGEDVLDSQKRLAKVMQALEAEGLNFAAQRLSEISREEHVDPIDYLKSNPSGHRYENSPAYKSMDEMLKKKDPSLGYTRPQFASMKKAVTEDYTGPLIPLDSISHISTAASYTPIDVTTAAQDPKEFQRVPATKALAYLRNQNPPSIPTSHLLEPTDSTISQLTTPSTQSFYNSRLFKGLIGDAKAAVRPLAKAAAAILGVYVAGTAIANAAPTLSNMLTSATSFVEKAVTDKNPSQYIPIISNDSNNTVAKDQIIEQTPTTQKVCMPDENYPENPSIRDLVHARNNAIAAGLTTDQTWSYILGVAGLTHPFEDPSIIKDPTPGQKFLSRMGFHKGLDLSAKAEHKKGFKGEGLLAMCDGDAALKYGINTGWNSTLNCDIVNEKIVFNYFHQTDRTRDLFPHKKQRTAITSGKARVMQIEKDQLIGYVGSTGRSTGTHLHLEVKVSRQIYRLISSLYGGSFVEKNDWEFDRKTGMYRIDPAWFLNPLEDNLVRGVPSLEEAIRRDGYNFPCNHPGAIEKVLEFPDPSMLAKK